MITKKMGGTVNVPHVKSNQYDSLAALKDRQVDSLESRVVSVVDLGWIGREPAIVTTRHQSNAVLVGYL